jgi:hypothetical protein
MFRIEEITTWDAADALAVLKQHLPPGWQIEHTWADGWYGVALKNDQGADVWVGGKSDPKLVYLDALGWLVLRDHKTQHPAWRPRTEEVALYRRTEPVVVATPDPEDLDPAEVDAVYKTSR